MLKLAVQKNHIPVNPEQMTELAEITEGYIFDNLVTLDRT